MLNKHSLFFNMLCSTWNIILTTCSSMKETFLWINQIPILRIMWRQLNFSIVVCINCWGLIIWPSNFLCFLAFLKSSLVNSNSLSIVLMVRWVRRWYMVLSILSITIHSSESIHLRVLLACSYSWLLCILTRVSKLI